MSRTYFMSDPHRDHDLVARLRGFPEVADWNAHLDDVVRSTMTKRDTMWWLGDMTAGGHIREMLAWVASLPGTHHLVAGNHCAVHPMFIGAHTKQRDYLEAFASVQTIAKRKIGSHRVLLSHFPIAGDHTDQQRYDLWRPRPFEGILVHGHTHSSGKVSTCGATLQLHVGYDAWGRPVGEEELLAIIEDPNTPVADCGCLDCEAFEVRTPHWSSTFRACGRCGYKRCDGAVDHRLPCTGDESPLGGEPVSARQ